MKTRHLLLRAAAIVAAGTLLAGCSSGAQPAENPSANATVQSNVTYTDQGGLTRYKSPVNLSDNIVTRGPDGEVPVWYNTLQLSKADVDAIKGKNLRAAIVFHLTSPFNNAIMDGAKKTFEQMGIKVVAESSAEGDDAKLQNNIQTALALKPDIMFSIALDPVADRAAFQSVANAGVKLVFGSVKPEGFKAGKDYTSLVTYDISGLGDVTADAMGKGVGGEGKVGVMYYDANFFITNQREKVFLDTLKAKYPKIDIVDRAPMSDPARAEDVANAMLAKHPDMKAIFAPWDTAAEGVVAALRQLGRTDIKVYTIDLGATNALDMAKGGNIAEMTSTLAVEFGSTAAIAGAYGVLGKQAPSMAIVPAFAVDKGNLPAGWETTFGTALPTDVQNALK